MKQTAVEWLLDQLTSIGVLEIPQGSNAVTSMIEQAKEMEQHQIIDAYIEGYSAPENLGDSQQYYKETFNK